MWREPLFGEKEVDTQHTVNSKLNSWCMEQNDRPQYSPALTLFNDTDFTLAPFEAQTTSYLRYGEEPTYWRGWDMVNIIASYMPKRRNRGKRLRRGRSCGSRPPTQIHPMNPHNPLKMTTKYKKSSDAPSGTEEW